MSTIKYTEAKTKELKQAINLLDMYRSKMSLALIKRQAIVVGLELKGRSFKTILPELQAFYAQALNIEEAETLTVTF